MTFAEADLGQWPQKYGVAVEVTVHKPASVEFVWGPWKWLHELEVWGTAQLAGSAGADWDRLTERRGDVAGLTAREAGSVVFGLG